ncbi:MAG: hypothetical protein ACE5FL_09425, partial [Myxococcota bacterium]
MTTIFSQVRDWLIDLLVDAGVPRAEIREDLAQDRDGPIAWDVVVSLCARYERVLPDREGRIAAVRRAASARFRRVASAPSGGFVDQRQFYWSAQHWLLPALLPTLTTEAHELPDGRVSCTVESPADATACPVLFELIGGAVMAVPHLFGHPKTPVEVEICDRCGVYIMKPPSPDDNVAPTENRAAPEEWRERFESILRGSGQIVYDWDTRTGTVEIHGEHDSLEIHIGPTKNRLRDFLLHMSDADRARFRAELRRAMKAKDRFYFEISIPQPGSEPIAVEHEGYFILDTAGEIRRMVGFARNVTDRKRGEKARRDHQRVLDRVAGSSPEILYLFDAQASRF